VSNVLGICGSPVRGGSTDVLILEMLRGARTSGAATEIIYLNELTIMPCQACGESPGEGYCFFHDGMDEVYAKFDWCDAVIVGSPIYFDSVSAQVKLFIDRTNCFRTLNVDGPQYFIPRITKRRRGAIILVGGEREKYDAARSVVAGFFVWANVKPDGLITYARSTWGKGTAAEDAEVMKRAFELGAKLAQESPPEKPAAGE
jgi:multimeric flavodoxin WrbA